MSSKATQEIDENNSGMTGDSAHAQNASANVMAKKRHRIYASSQVDEAAKPSPTGDGQDAAQDAADGRSPADGRNLADGRNPAVAENVIAAAQKRIEELSVELSMPKSAEGQAADRPVPGAIRRRPIDRSASPKSIPAPNAQTARGDDANVLQKGGTPSQMNTGGAASQHNQFAGSKAPGPVASRLDRRNVDSVTTVLQKILDLEAELISSNEAREIAYFLANETRKVVPVRQVFVLGVGESSVHKVTVVTGHETLDHNSPFIRTMSAVAKEVSEKKVGEKLYEFTLSEFVTDVELLAVYPFHSMVWIPLEYQGEQYGSVLYCRESAWRKSDCSILERFTNLASVVYRGRQSVKPKLTSKITTKNILLVAIIAVFVLALIPTQNSALAPAQIVSLQQSPVVSAIDSQIQEVLVEPNQSVSKGDLLVRLRSTDIRNELNIAKQELALAKVKLVRLSQAALFDRQYLPELVEARSEVSLREARIQFASDRLVSALITADRDGVVLFSSKSELVGAPVQTGTRIMSVVEPNLLRLEIKVPVADATALENDGRVRLYLDARPLDPVEATIDRVSYQATLNDDQTFSYEVSAKFAPDELETLKLGERGTAQVYGSDTNMFMYLFRKPLAALRQTIGI